MLHCGDPIGYANLECLLDQAFLWIWQTVKESKMIERITFRGIEQMTNKEGIIFQGCGGDLKEMEDGVNELLTEAEILLEGDTFHKVYAFAHEGLTFCLIWKMSS